MQLKGTVYVSDHRARLHMHHGTLMVNQPSGSQRIPIEAIEGIILLSRAEISNDAMGELIRRGIRIAALSRTGRLRFTVGGAVSGNVNLRISQYGLSADPIQTASIARWIVAGKLQNCRRAIQRWSWDAQEGTRKIMEHEVAVISDRISDLTGTTNGDKIRGIEGDGTRRYFKCLALHLDAGNELLSFVRRSRRPPRDPSNSVLSFMYGLVLAECVGALEAVGLDPQIGYLHRPRSGRPSLALDILEEMRPAVADRFAINILSRRQIRNEHFEVVGSGYYLSDEGRTCLLELYDKYRNDEVDHIVFGHRVARWMLPTIQATLMARYIRGDLPAYPPFLTVN